jgi:hypothetical protein
MSVHYRRIHLGLYTRSSMPASRTLIGSSSAVGKIVPIYGVDGRPISRLLRRNQKLSGAEILWEIMAERHSR